MVGEGSIDKSHGRPKYEALIKKQLSSTGIPDTVHVHWNLQTDALYKEALARGEGELAKDGPFVVKTGTHTGRAPQDKFIVREPSSEKYIWWGEVNRAFDAGRFEALHKRYLSHLDGKDLFVQDCFVGTDPAYRHPIRVITETAWHSIFTRTMFITDDPNVEASQGFDPEFTIMSMPSFQAKPEIEGTNSSTCIIVHFGKRLVLIGGTSYAGEIKKSAFTIMNYILPLQGVLSMHSSANIGPKGGVTVFFGLSGTGKTSLSADRRRTLIGDDEHGWSDHGIFNFEAGCYAKMIRLSKSAEPEIYGTTKRFGTLLENVVMDPVTKELDLDDDSLTENTRGAYPISFISNASPDGLGAHPSNIVMLTADAFGVLPPISKLNPDQAKYHFLSGYTAKVAGTEEGITEPKATFSACFGAPFMALDPIVYARLLGDKIAKHNVSCWLVNTGWTGGPYGVGSRINIGYTRAMVDAALDGLLEAAPTRTDPIFGIEAIRQCPGVPERLLDPRSSWEDPKAYDAKARELAERFQSNFAQFTERVLPGVRQAAPRVDRAKV